MSRITDDLLVVHHTRHTPIACYHTVYARNTRVVLAWSHIARRRRPLYLLDSRNGHIISRRGHSIFPDTRFRDGKRHAL